MVTISIILIRQTAVNENERWTNAHFSIQFTDDQVFYYLLVDSLKPIEILVGFSALVHWGDTSGKANVEKCMLMLCFPNIGYVCAVVFVCGVFWHSWEFSIK